MLRSLNKRLTVALPRFFGALRVLVQLVLLRCLLLWQHKVIALSIKDCQTLKLRWTHIPSAISNWFWPHFPFPCQFLFHTLCILDTDSVITQQKRGK